MVAVCAGLDREKAREVLLVFAEYGDGETEVQQALDALGECVTPGPAQTIDRDDLHDELLRGGHPLMRVRTTADRILALLRPDPRIAAIEALCNNGPWTLDRAERRVVTIDNVLAILRGEQ